MTSTWHSVALIVGLLLVLASLPMSCGEKVDPRVLLANETIRVDYEDGVSCYHRASALSCTYVPTRAPHGPSAPAVFVEDIIPPRRTIP
jgi:hypothetical protein